MKLSDFIVIVCNSDYDVLIIMVKQYRGLLGLYVFVMFRYILDIMNFFL